MKKITMPKIKLKNPFEPIDVPDMHADYIEADREHTRKRREAHAHRFEPKTS